MKEAVEQTGATASCIFVPAPFVESAVMEAAEAGIMFIAVITEGVPAQDEARFYNRLQQDFPEVRLLGPNCPGIITPGQVQHRYHRRRDRNAWRPRRYREPLRHADLPGAVRADPEGHRRHDLRRHRRRPGAWHDVHRLSRRPSRPIPKRKALIMIGEIGGSEEEKAAAFIGASMTQPVVAYVAGATAPPGKKMGHAGAIISGSQGTAQAKMEALRAAGVQVAINPTEAGEMMAVVVRDLAR